MDENKLAEGKDYCGIYTRVSPSHKLLAYTADFIGGETYRLFIKGKELFIYFCTRNYKLMKFFLDIESDQLVEPEDASPEMDAGICWGSDDSTIFYLKMDEAHRPYQVYRHKIGETYENDELLFEENDDLVCTLDDGFMEIF